MVFFFHSQSSFLFIHVSDTKVVSKNLGLGILRKVGQVFDGADQTRLAGTGPGLVAHLKHCPHAENGSSTTPYVKLFVDTCQGHRSPTKKYHGRGDGTVTITILVN